MSDVVGQQCETFAALEGRRVERWSGIEMAAREEGPDGRPVFAEVSVACIQMMVLDLELDGGEPLTMLTRQNELGWGIWTTPGNGPDQTREWDGIYRWRTLPELPPGTITRVELRFSDEGDVGELLLHVEGTPLLLVAAEIHETASVRLELHVPDESILVFTDVAAADAISWLGDRARRVQR